MSVNSIQIGGVHYATNGNFQHWDFVVAARMQYLEGNAAKYIVRKKENRAQDIQKAIHYIDKIIELYDAGKYTWREDRPDVLQLSTLCYKLSEVYPLTWREHNIVYFLARWVDREDLLHARGLALDLLAESAPTSPETYTYTYNKKE